MPGFAYSGDNSPLRPPSAFAASILKLAFSALSSSNEGASELQDRVYLLFIDWMNAEVSIEPGQLRGEFPGAARGIFSNRLENWPSDDQPRDNS
jgi:hypothetical protein